MQTISEMFGGSSQLLTMLPELSSTIWFDLIIAHLVVVGSWEEPPPKNWWVVAKNSFVSWALNLRVRMSLKGAVISIDFFIIFLHLFLGFSLNLEISKTQCLTTFRNTLKFIQNSVLCAIFSAIFSLLGNVVKQSFVFEILLPVLSFSCRLQFFSVYKIVWWSSTKKEVSNKFKSTF